MAVSTRFATGVHTLVTIAAEPAGVLTSDQIAERLNTNPVVIRRVLALLQRAGLIGNQKGPSGGSKLTRPAKAIRLGEVYRALTPQSLFRISGAHGDRLNTGLTKVLAGAESALEAELNESNIAQLAKKLLKDKK